MRLHCLYNTGLSLQHGSVFTTRVCLYNTGLSLQHGSVFTTRVPRHPLRHVHSHPPQARESFVHYPRWEVRGQAWGKRESVRSLFGLLLRVHIVCWFTFNWWVCPFYWWVCPRVFGALRAANDVLDNRERVCFLRLNCLYYTFFTVFTTLCRSHAQRWC